MIRADLRSVSLLVALFVVACGGETEGSLSSSGSTSAGAAGNAGQAGAAGAGGKAGQPGVAGKAGQPGQSGAGGAVSAGGAGGTAGVGASGGVAGASGGVGGASGVAGASGQGAGGLSSAGGASGQGGGGGSAGQGAQGGTSGDCGGLATGLQDCDACMNLSCCSQEAACSTNPDCLPLLLCLLGCGGEVCAQDCFVAHVAGADSALGLIGCLNEQCGGVCEGGGGSGGSAGGCAHEVCDQGPPLQPSCSACAAQVCGSDEYCCTESWDNQCIEESEQLCGVKCGGVGGAGGSGGGSCSSVTCPKGCCDDAGQCVAALTDDACGDKGASCVDCLKQGSFCDSSRSCKGCARDCEGKVCGEQDGCGGVCDGVCPAQQVCTVGSKKLPDGCYPCGPDSCDGCCAPDGSCQVGTARQVCGSQGVACADCGELSCYSDKNVEVVGGVAVVTYINTCSPCGSGCSSSGCEDDGCGNLCPGASCAPQGPGPAPTCQINKAGVAECKINSSVCAPALCDGCCDGILGTCVDGGVSDKCGSGGLLCVNCAAMGLACDAVTGQCAGCTPACDSSSSCGKPNGCGGVCTGPEGGQCAPGLSCDAEGKCVCGGQGQLLCLDQATSKMVCRDTEGDPENCGACGNLCPEGVACEGGKCACPEGSYACSSLPGSEFSPVCTNIGTDPKNCGSCHYSCLDTPCEHGQCGKCPAGKKACFYNGFQLCADTSSDPKHCGGCGIQCPQGVACKDGVCG